LEITDIIRSLFPTKKKTISYKSSKGNVKNAQVHLFDNGSTDYVVVNATGETTWPIILQWNQPFASLGGSGAKTNLDIVFSKLDIIKGKYGDIMGHVATNNVGEDAFEGLGLQVKKGDSFRLYIANANGGPAPSFVLVVANTLLVSPVLQQGFTSYGHCSSAYGFSIGAADAANTPPFGVNPPQLEYYSSWGGIPRFFDQNRKALKTPVTSLKPDFVAPDCTQTSFFGDPGNNNEFFFCGTSAASPASASLSALILQNRPNITFEQLGNALRSTTIPFAGQTGFTFQFGFGYLNGSAAAAAAFATQVTNPSGSGPIFKTI